MYNLSSTQRFTIKTNDSEVGPVSGFLETLNILSSHPLFPKLESNKCIYFIDTSSYNHLVGKFDVSTYEDEICEHRILKGTPSAN